MPSILNALYQFNFKIAIIIEVNQVLQHFQRKNSTKTGTSTVLNILVLQQKYMNT